MINNRFNVVYHLLGLVKFYIMEKGTKIVFREKSSYCNNFILNGEIIYQTADEYVISCMDYPWMWNKEVILKKPKNNMIWLIHKI